MNFTTVDGERITVPGRVGQNLLQVRSHDFFDITKTVIKTYLCFPHASTHCQVARDHGLPMQGGDDSVALANQIKHSDTWTEDVFYAGLPSLISH